MKMSSGILGYLMVMVLSISSANQSPIDPSSLSSQECLDQFSIEKYLPLSEILTDVLTAYRYDPEVKAAFDHLVSSEFKTKMDKLEKREEYKKLKEFFDTHDMKTFQAINLFKTILPTLASQAESIPSQNVKPAEMTGGIHGLLMRIFKSRVSLEGIRNGFNGRMACDLKYKENMQLLFSPEFKGLLGKLRETEEYKNVAADLEEYKIYLDMYLDKMLDFFNIEH